MKNLNWANKKDPLPAFPTPRDVFKIKQLQLHLKVMSANNGSIMSQKTTEKHIKITKSWYVHTFFQFQNRTSICGFRKH